MLGGLKIYLVMFMLVLLRFHANNGEICDHSSIVCFYTMLAITFNAWIKSA